MKNKIYDACTRFYSYILKRMTNGHHDVGFMLIKSQ